MTAALALRTRTKQSPDSLSLLHKFAWTIRFAVRKHLSALAVDLPCRSLFPEAISTKDLSTYRDEECAFGTWACRFCLSWLLRYTTAEACKTSFTYITICYQCQATNNQGRESNPTSTSTVYMKPSPNCFYKSVFFNSASQVINIGTPLYISTSQLHAIRCFTSLIYYSLINVLMLRSKKSFIKNS